MTYRIDSIRHTCKGHGDIPDASATVDSDGALKWRNILSASMTAYFCERCGEEFPKTMAEAFAADADMRLAAAEAKA